MLRTLSSCLLLLACALLALPVDVAAVSKEHSGKFHAEAVVCAGGKDGPGGYHDGEGGYEAYQKFMNHWGHNLIISKDAVRGPQRCELFQVPVPKSHTLTLELPPPAPPTDPATRSPSRSR